MEKELADFIFDVLGKDAKNAQVSPTDPDVVLIVETIGNWVGAGFTAKGLKQK